MKNIYFTVTGMNFRYGSFFLDRGMLVGLSKEPDNKYDKEAIKVMLPGIDTIGYVANSIRTVIGSCYSAGRLYDLIGDTATGRVMYVLDGSAICKLEDRDTRYFEDEITGKIAIDDPFDEFTDLDGEGDFTGPSPYNPPYAAPSDPPSKPSPKKRRGGRKDISDSDDFGSDGFGSLPPYFEL